MKISAFTTKNTNIVAIVVGCAYFCCCSKTIDSFTISILLQISTKLQSLAHESNLHFLENNDNKLLNLESKNNESYTKGMEIYKAVIESNKN